MGDRERRTKKNKVDWDEFKAARDGKVSLLERMEDDEDDVFDVVDEEEYAKIVETRRNAGDFVVDDEGHGYYDDGEEHLGITEEDPYERQKRKLLEESDKKTSRKAKKLSEGGGESAQKSTMLSFMRNNVASQPKVAKPTSNASAVDVDNLFDSLDDSKGKSKKSVSSISSVKPKLQNVKKFQPNTAFFDFEEENMDTYANENDDFQSSAEEHYPSQQEAGYTELNASEVLNNNEVKTEKEDQHTFQKLSLSKTSKKFKIEDDAPQQSKNNSQKDIQIKYDGSDALGTVDNAIDPLGDSTIASDPSMAKVDPAFWIQKEGSEEFVEMFWLDASEHNGVIYLFGKVAINDPSNKGAQYATCCVAIHGCERNLFVLPSKTGEFYPNGDPVRATLPVVYAELNKVLIPDVIPRGQGQGFKCKQVKRNYAFEHGDIPREETDYLKIVYSAKYGLPSPATCSGGKSYERIFGTGSTPLEWFLLKRRLMGPCWIKIRNPKILSDSMSWCRIEIAIESPKNVCVISERKPSPPLTTLTISMKTIVNPSTNLHEIVVLSGLVHTKVDCEGETEANTKLMRRFAIVRQLGLSCGSDYPSVFPHDLQTEIKKINGFTITTMPNERALLSYFGAKLGLEDPDVIVSHNLVGFEYDVLLSRAVANKVNTLWSKLGRLKRSKPARNINDKDVSAGRLLCDTYKSSKEFLRETSYSLTSLAQRQLSFTRVDIEPIDVPKYFSSSSNIIRLAQHTANDTGLVQKLMLKLQIIPLTKQLTNLSGNMWARTMRGQRAERIEYLLMHEFHANKFVLPERQEEFAQKKQASQVNTQDDDDDDLENKVGGKSRSRGKASYAGGLVLEPKKGLYDTYILLLDFNSLYPSIIQEYNLCFTTVDWTKYMEPKSDATTSTKKVSGKMGGKSQTSTSQEDTSKSQEIDEASDDEEIDAAVPQAVSASANILPPIPTSETVGHLPKVIKNLVDRRREVKNLLKKERDPTVREQLDIRQKALKLTANSMYGCLGFSYSRFYARPIAALVTAKGREALQRTVDFAQNHMNLDVIYGDTDSVMINTGKTDLAEVKKLGAKVKEEVNKLYKALELDLDGIFKSMLLLKKKKYAALVIKEDGDKIEYEPELKGLDLVRRDWCPLSQDTGRYVVNQILSGKNRDDIVIAIHDYLRDLAGKIRNNEVDVAQFIITKGLNKNPRDYPDCKGQAHLQVALRMLKENKPVNIGDHIPYIICVEGPDGATPPQRAYHPEEIARSDGKLHIDVEWYLSMQILPPIARLCEPIEGTSSNILSLQLGLDPVKYGAKSKTVDNFDEGWAFTPKYNMEDSERFKDCFKLTVGCSSCKKEFELPGVMNEFGNSGLSCINCGVEYFGRYNAANCYSYLCNRVSSLVRKSLKKYYDCWLVCDDPSCGMRTTKQWASGLRCVRDCHGHMVQEYNEETLHTQLKYLESLFDYERAIVKCSKAEATLAESANRKLKFLQSMSEDHREVLKLLKQHMFGIAVKDSAYNWIRPSLWTTVFAKSLQVKISGIN